MIENKGDNDWLNIGQRIKSFRKELGISREELCRDESSLSLRQLGRIERGDSYPKLETLNYIANELGISLAQLISDIEAPLPNRYKELKYLIIRTPIYNNASTIQELCRYFNEIERDYFPMISVDERDSIKILKATIDVHVSNDLSQGKSVLKNITIKDFFKDNFTINDLLKLRLYMSCQSPMEKEFWYRYHDLVPNILKHCHQFILVELILLRDILINFISMELIAKQDCYCQLLLAQLEEMMLRTQDFQKKPIVQMLTWKYYLHLVGDRMIAEENFQKAVAYAKIIEDRHLEKQLCKEWMTDLSTFVKK